MEGKTHLQPFVDPVSQASKLFELIHSDLKELPVLLFHKFKYFVTFLDDFSSHCWVVLLKKKSDTIKAIDDFLAMVRTQHSTMVKEFMTDAGGECKSLNLINKFKELGILLQFFLFCLVYLYLFIIFSKSWRCRFDSLLFDSYHCHTIDS